MKSYKLLLSLSFFLLSPFFISAQEKFTISGTLKDGATGEDIIGARIAVLELPGTGAISNTFGFYSLTLPKGTYTLQYKSLGFQTFEEKIESLCP